VSFVDILSFRTLHKMQSEITKDKASKKKKDRTWVEAAKIVSSLQWSAISAVLSAVDFICKIVFVWQCQIVAIVARIHCYVNINDVLRHNIIYSIIWLQNLFRHSDSRPRNSTHRSSQLSFTTNRHRGCSSW